LAIKKKNGMSLKDLDDLRRKLIDFNDDRIKQINFTYINNPDKHIDKLLFLLTCYRNSCMPENEVSNLYDVDIASMKRKNLIF